MTTEKARRWEVLSDEELQAFSAPERRVIRLMAVGGWSSGTPSLKTVERVCDLLGLTFRDEQSRGEPRAFWPAGRQTAAWQQLAARLDALPRRRSR